MYQELPRTRTAHKLLVVDDDPHVCNGMSEALRSEGYQVRTAGSVSEALGIAGNEPLDAALVDHGLPDGSALDFLQRLRGRGDTTPVLVFSGTGTCELAVAAIKAGADDFLSKPVRSPVLLEMLERLLARRRAQGTLAAPGRSRVTGRFDPFIGTSAAIRNLSQLAHAVLHSQAPVLILGETGTGKGVLARWLHDHGRRASAAYVDLNCAGLGKELVESELFGHRRGAFTGAATDKGGLLELAHTGTLFLDELGDLDLTVQPKLLKVLEEKRFRRLGDVQAREVDVRLIAATHRDLQRMVEAGSFREDLQFRINTLVFELPSLRSRPEDIVPVACALLDRISAEQGRPSVELSEAACDALHRHPWPGNLRELRNTLERALIFCHGDRLELDMLRLHSSCGSAPRARFSSQRALESLADVERRYVVRALQEENGKVDAAARRLGIARSSLYAKIKRFGLPTS
jgi:DNA-binding NtrC family response regulator